jgi:hypothetical protein
MELNGTGMLNDTENWLFHGPNFRLLPPHTLERTRVGIQTHKIVLPAI